MVTDGYHVGSYGDVGTFGLFFDVWCISSSSKGVPRVYSQTQNSTKQIRACLRLPIEDLFGDFLKMGVPHVIIHFNRIFHDKHVLTIHFWGPPF